MASDRQLATQAYLALREDMYRRGRPRDVRVTPEDAWRYAQWRSDEELLETRYIGPAVLSWLRDHQRRILSA